MRQQMVNLKYNPLVENLRGRNVLLVDDSLVRGTTIRQLVLVRFLVASLTVTVIQVCPSEIFTCPYCLSSYYASLLYGDRHEDKK